METIMMTEDLREAIKSLLEATKKPKEEVIANSSEYIDELTKKMKPEPVIINPDLPDNYDMVQARINDK